jgi:hypothetical protein
MKSRIEKFFLKTNRFILLVLLSFLVSFCLKAKKSMTDIRNPSSFFTFYMIPILFPSSSSSASCGSAEKEITAFSFPASSTGLSVDYKGVISGTDISVLVPYGIGVTSLIASFSTTGSFVKVGTAIQTSGVSANNFSNPVTFTVTGADNCTKDYKVTLTKFNPVLSTGVTNCYDNSGVLSSCGNSSYPRQDGDFANAGYVRSFSSPMTNTSYPSDYITKDKLTGSLVWKTCSNGQSGSTCTGTANTLDYTTSISFCTSLNSLNSNNGFAGITDWRLPTVSELRTLINYANSSPSIDTNAFPNQQSVSLSTSTESPINTTNHFVNIFTSGNLNLQTKSNSTASRCVSGTTPLAASFLDNGDETITDSSTNLRWQKCSLGLSGSSCTGTASTHTWSNALLACNNLTSLGKAWRLPNVNELQSIISYTVGSAPLINPTFFPGTVSNFYWSSTTNASNANQGWYVDFASGTIASAASKTGNSFNVRCVTNGP